MSARRRALSAASLAVLSLGMGGTAFAQDAAAPAAGGETAVQEVVVTGSRIAKRDFSSSSPIVTVSQQTLQNSSNVALEANLNKLPQFSPAQNLTGVNSQDVQPTATNSVGAATLSLRGLGPNRNLVLVDGRRMQPINGLNVVDLNTIPAAMVDHVEVITGGASAVYGADAVGGVVNFILKKNFRGVDIDAQYGITQAGDGQEFKLSTLFGTDFADGKGNVMFGLEHYTRGASYQKNRDFYTDSWADPTVATNEFFFTGAAFNPNVFNAPSQAVVNSIFSGRAAGTTVPSSGIQFYFNPDGTVFTGATSGFGSNGAAGAYRFQGNVNGVQYGPRTVLDPYSGNTTATAIKSTQTNYFVTSPANRWSVNGAAHYDFNDYVSVYTQGTFAQTRTETVLFPSPFITGWGVNIPRDGAHPVSAELAQLLNSRPDPTAPWELYLIPDPSAWMPARGTHDVNTVWQMTLGLNGKIPHTDLTWDVYGSHGNAEAYSIGDGYASLVRYQQLLTSPNYGAGQTITGNQGAPNFGFGSASAHCTSGFYSAIFEGGTPSKDCIDAITAHLQNTTLTSQDVVEANVQGSLFRLPAGELRFSLGASYRENNVQYNPDVLQSTSSFADQVVGVYPAAYMNASTSAKEVFGELSVPVVRDLPFAKSFDLELGARYSSYGAVDRLNDIHIDPPGGWTYKILGDWAINDWLRARGGYNLAVRSPNVGELFLGKQEVYAAGAATSYGDPCSYASTAPFGAGGAGVDPVTGKTFAVVNTGGATGAQNALAICRGLMGTTGAATYYASQQAPGAPSPFGFVYQQGSTDLKSEQARTWTAGLVVRSPWDKPLFSRLSASVDWYKISVNGAIEFQSVDNVKQACLSQDASTAAALAAALASPACQLLSRNSGTGAEAPTTIAFDNLATIKTSGVDVQVNWGADIADMGFEKIPGALNLNVLVNWLDYFDTVSAPGQPVQHWAGTLGPNLNGTNPGAFKWKLNTTLTYAYGPGSLSLNWRHLPSVHSQTYGQPGDNSLDTASHDEFGLYGTWEVTRNYILRAGVDNLFNASPEITGANTGIPGFSLPSSGRGTTNEGLYDSLGRRFYVGVKAKF